MDDIKLAMLGNKEAGKAADGCEGVGAVPRSVGETQML